MQEITQIRKLSIWIFLIPFIGINLCLIISQNPEIFEDTIFSIDFKGRTGSTIPHLDGTSSISRASRTLPQYLHFKPSMVLTSILLFYYWKSNNSLVNNLYNTDINYKFKIFGVLSAFFLIIHSLLLGTNFDIKIFKLLRRVVLLSFIIFEIIAQGILVFHFYKLKNKLKNFVNSKILTLKIILVFILSIVAIVSLPMLTNKGYTHFKHALEWNYFIGVILFYLLSRFFWKKND